MLSFTEEILILLVTDEGGFAPAPAPACRAPSWGPS